MLHVGQHLAERELHGLIQRQHSGVFQLLPEFCRQLRENGRILHRIGNRHSQKLCGAPLQRRIAAERIEQISGQRRVEHKIPERFSLIQQTAHQGFDIVADFPDSRLEIFQTERVPLPVIQRFETIHLSLDAHAPAFDGKGTLFRTAAEFKQRFRLGGVNRQRGKRNDLLLRPGRGNGAAALPGKFQRIERGIDCLPLLPAPFGVPAGGADGFEDFGEGVGIFVSMFFIDLLPRDSAEGLHDGAVEREFSLEQKDGEDRIAGVFLPAGAVVVGRVESVGPSDVVGFGAVGRDDLRGGVLHRDASIRNRAVCFRDFFDRRQFPESWILHNQRPFLERFQGKVLSSGGKIK